MITRLSQLLSAHSETWRVPAAGLVAAWVITGIGIFATRWDVAAIGILVAVTTTTVTAVVQMRMSSRTDVNVRMRLGELWALVGLQNGQNLPALEGSAIGIEGGYALISLIRDQQHSRVVELGPGASSALLHLAAGAARSEVQITALEHDDLYVNAVRTLADRMSFPSFRVISAPLEEHELPDWHGFWYAAGAVDELPDSFDLLVVDGPPNYQGGDNRYPALPLLGDRLRHGAFVYVDDTDRESEHRMVERWLSELPCELVRRGQTFTLLRWTGADDAG